MKLYHPASALLLILYQLVIKTTLTAASHSAFVQIKVCTRLNQHRPVPITVHDNLLFTATGYCSDCPSYVIIHGWGNGQTADWMATMKDELFRTNRNINVFLIDWTPGSNTLSLGSQDLFGYEGAIRNMNDTIREINAYLNEFIKRGYIARVGKTMEMINVHCIGHSLGAHICGLVGKLMKSNSRAKFTRITGLDPAGPCFDAYTDENRLSIGDAEFVDVIHTSGTFGFHSRIGHADFYPHDGSQQPGCYLINRQGEIVEVYDQSLITMVLCNREINFSISNKLMKSLLHDVSVQVPGLDDLIDMSRNITVFSKKNMTFSIRNASVSSDKAVGSEVEVNVEERLAGVPVPNLFAICSHNRAVQYFIESIRYRAKCRFLASQCSTWDFYTRQLCERCGKNQMGFFSMRPNSPATYYLNVNSNTPFCVAEVTTPNPSTNLFYCNSGMSGLVSIKLNIFGSCFLLLVKVICSVWN